VAVTLIKPVFSNDVALRSIIVPTQESFAADLGAMLTSAGCEMDLSKLDTPKRHTYQL
jgi:hypothetical protein